MTAAGAWNLLAVPGGHKTEPLAAASLAVVPREDVQGDGPGAGFRGRRADRVHEPRGRAVAPWLWRNPHREDQPFGRIRPAADERAERADDAEPLTDQPLTDQP